jgi:broad specificity phosphatase PhoE
MTTYVIRHAPTPANAGKVFMGQTDVEAAPFQVQPLPLLAPRTVHSSPLSRAVVAAEALFPGEPLHLDDRLMERSVGAWAGLDHATVTARWPDAFLSPGVLNHELTPPGGEPLDAFIERVADFLASVRNEEQDLYAVTHNGWIRVALMLTGRISRAELFAEPVPFLEPLVISSTR